MNVDSPTTTISASAPPQAVPSRALSLRPTSSRATRWVLAIIGLVSVSVGAIGVFVPGLPTTIFLLFASWCFARSCPWLEQKLVRNRLFEPFLRVIDSEEGIPMRARITSIAVMWIAISISVGTLVVNHASLVLVGGIIAAGAVGTVCIWRFRRPADGNQPPIKNQALHRQPGR